jgi:hypothetical protein
MAKDDTMIRSRCSTEETDDMTESSSGMDMDRVDPALDEKYLEEPQKDYELRENARTKPGVSNAAAWLDTDMSGNYHPAFERSRRRNPCIAGSSRAKRTDEDRNRKKSMVSELERLARIENGCSEIVTFIFVAKADEAKAIISNIPDNWAEEKNVFHTDSYNLRSRAQQDDDGECTNGEQPRLRDPAGIEDDLWGHPSARGCIHCRKHGERCPLLDGGGKWPCSNCVEERVDCELIVTPQTKGRCLACKRKRLTCSFQAEDANHVGPCADCKFRRINCIAGPPGGKMPERPTIDHIQKLLDAAEDNYTRPYKSCTACRENKVECSLKAWTDEPPCENCEHIGVECTFKSRGKTAVDDGRAEATEPVDEYDMDMDRDADELAEYEYESTSTGQSDDNGGKDVGTTDVMTKAKAWGYELEPIQEESESESESDFDDSVGSDDSMMTIVAAHQGTLGPQEAICTGLSHPVAFLCRPDATSILKCHWCENPSYGLLTPDWKENVVVRRCHDKVAYVEVSGGNGPTYPPSRMCSPCTMKRYYIVSCKGHELVQIRFELGSLQNLDDMAAHFERMRKNQPKDSDKWCSICAQVASFECGTTQEADMWGEQYPTIGPAHYGCGLRLCLGCKLEFDKLGGRLNSLVAAACSGDLGEDAWIDEPRPDAELLSTHSMMVKALLYSNGFSA